MNIKNMEKLAKEIRVETLDMILNRGFGHLGGSMSIVETLATLYSIMDIDPKNPKKPNRDYLVLSKGHAGPALYSVLAIKEFFPREILKTLNKNNTILPSHPDRNLTPGVDMTTGSLGQGISVAAGIAAGLSNDDSNKKVYCIVGDGELNEGQCWEAIQFIAHKNLKNLVLFIDYNKKQLDGRTKEICNEHDIVGKFKSFGYDATMIDGASIEEILETLNCKSDRPKAIILDTIKGKGIRCIETLEKNHHIRPNEKLKKQLEEDLIRLKRELV